MAEDLARRSGLSLNEWVSRLMADGPEDATSQDYFDQDGATTYDAAPRASGQARYEAYGHPADEVGRVTQAIERLSDRIQTAESRQVLAISGIERSVREVIERIDSAEREQMQVAARFEGAVQEVKGEAVRLSERLRQIEAEAAGPRSAEALRALEGALGKVAGHVYDTEKRSRDTLAELRARMEQLGEDDPTTSEAIRELRQTCTVLDERLALAEKGAQEGIEAAAVNLSTRVDTTREELSQQLAAAADARFERVEQALARMTEHVRAAEQRSAGAVEKMGREVLDVAKTLSRRVQMVEHQNADAAGRVSAEISRIATAVEDRLGRADTVQAQALEKLGGEIARITERLADRISNAERRSAQAIDDVGEQVARVTERIGQRNDRTASELAERIRQSEERTARLLDEARQKIDERLAETQRRLAEPPPRPAVAGPYEEADEGLFVEAPFPGLEGVAPQPDPAPVARHLEPAPVAPPVIVAPIVAPVITPAPIQAATPAVTFDDEDFEAVATFEPPLSEPLLSEAAHDEPVRFQAAQFEPVHPEPAPVADPGPTIFNPAPIIAASPLLASASAELAYAEPAHPAPSFDEPSFGEPQTAHASFVAADETPVARVVHESDGELDAVELEPNVGFDVDDDLIGPSQHTYGMSPGGGSTLFADQAPLSEPEPIELATPAPELPPAESAAPLTTREVIERARAAARATNDSNQRPRGGRMADESVLQSLTFGRARKRPGVPGGALMVASVLAAAGLSAGGYVLLQGPQKGNLPKSVADALSVVTGDQSGTPMPSSSAPIAAVALTPQQGATLGPDLTQPYAAAVSKISGGDNGGVADIRKLADQGYAPAQFYLGELYQDGKAGVKKDPTESRKWLEKAADGGDRTAMHNLALDEHEGIGGARDPAGAAEWFRRAAELGLIDSQYNLAALYEHGDGVAQNLAEAYKWYLIAGRAGDAGSRAGAERVRAGISADARSVAERAAADFQPTQPAAGAPTLAATTTPTPTTTPAPIAGSPDIVTAQRALNQLGYYQGPTDGAASPAIHLAIAAYQRDQNLPVTGNPDSATVDKLSVYTR